MAMCVLREKEREGGWTEGGKRLRICTEEALNRVIYTTHCTHGGSVSSDKQMVFREMRNELPRRLVSTSSCLPTSVFYVYGGLHVILGKSCD